MPHNPWGSTARRPCARWHPPAIGGQSHSCRVLITFMLRQAQHERSHGLATTRNVCIQLSHSASQCPPLNRSTGASQKAILTVGLDTPTSPHKVPYLPFAGASQNANHLPFALSLSKGGRELHNSHPFPRTSTGSARTEPRPLHHTKVCIQRRNAPTQPFDLEHSQNAILTVRLEPHKAPYLTVRLGPHKTPTLPFALSLSKGGRELRNSYTHSLVIRQAQNERCLRLLRYTERRRKL